MEKDTETLKFKIIKCCKFGSLNIFIYVNFLYKYLDICGKKYK